jgi:hypothetical protein
LNLAPSYTSTYEPTSNSLAIAYVGDSVPSATVPHALSVVAYENVVAPPSLFKQDFSYQLTAPATCLFSFGSQIAAFLEIPVTSPAVVLVIPVSVASFVVSSAFKFP